MKVIGAAYGKGGVGKSNTSLSLALETSARGIKTVIFELDQQGTILAALLGLKNTEKHDTTLDAGLSSDPIKPVKINENLYLVPSHPELSKLDKDSFVNILDNIEIHLKRFEEEGFELCIFDPPGTLENRLIVTMVVSDAIFAPFELSEESHNSFPAWWRVYQKIKKNRRYNPNLQFLGLVYTKIGKLSYRNVKNDGDLPEIMTNSEYRIYKAYSEKLPTVGMIASRDIIKTTVSRGKSISAATSKDTTAKKLAEREINMFVDNVLSKIGFDNFVKGNEETKNSAVEEV